MCILNDAVIPSSSWLSSLKRPFLVAVIAAMGAALILIFMPNYYKSEVRLLPLDAKSSSSGLGSLAAAAAAFGVGLPGQDASDSNYADIVASRRIREGLLKTEFRFHVRKWRYGKEQFRIQTLYEYLKAKNIDNGCDKVGAILTANRDLKTKILLLSAETKSPELSQQVVRRSAKLLEDFVMERGQTRAGQKASFTEARLSEARNESHAIEEVFRKFMDNNRNYQTSLDSSIRLQGLRIENEFKLQQQLVVTLALNREQALLEEKNDMPILNVLDDGDLPVEHSRPKRSLLVGLTFILAVAGSWAWYNREWLTKQTEK